MDRDRALQYWQMAQVRDMRSKMQQEQVNKFSISRFIVYGAYVCVYFAPIYIYVGVIVTSSSIATQCLLEGRVNINCGCKTE